MAGLSRRVFLAPLRSWGKSFKGILKRTRASRKKGRKQDETEIIGVRQDSSSFDESSAESSIGDEVVCTPAEQKESVLLQLFVADEPAGTEVSALSDTPLLVLAEYGAEYGAEVVISSGTNARDDDVDDETSSGSVDATGEETNKATKDINGTAKETSEADNETNEIDENNTNDANAKFTYEVAKRLGDKSARVYSEDLHQKASLNGAIAPRSRVGGNIVSPISHQVGSWFDSATPADSITTFEGSEVFSERIKTNIRVTTNTTEPTQNLVSFEDRDDIPLREPSIAKMQTVLLVREPPASLRESTFRKDFDDDDSLFKDLDAEEDRVCASLSKHSVVSYETDDASLVSNGSSSSDDEYSSDINLDPTARLALCFQQPYLYGDDFDDDDDDFDDDDFTEPSIPRKRRSRKASARAKQLEPQSDGDDEEKAYIYFEV